jgi:hypothetical protein
MNVLDYLIAPENLDWRKLLSFWVPPLPPDFNIWLVNRLGEVFAVAQDNSILYLDVGIGTCTPVARDQSHFATLLDAGNNAERLLRISLVNECRRVGMTLKPFECYGFKLPPTLGGRYEVANLVPTNLLVHYSYQAYIVKQEEIYWVPPA